MIWLNWNESFSNLLCCSKKTNGNLSAIFLTKKKINSYLNYERPKNIEMIKKSKILIDYEIWWARINLIKTKPIDSNSVLPLPSRCSEKHTSEKYPKTFSLATHQHCPRTVCVRYIVCSNRRFQFLGISIPIAPLSFGRAKSNLKTFQKTKSEKS